MYVCRGCAAFATYGGHEDLFMICISQVESKNESKAAQTMTHTVVSEDPISICAAPVLGRGEESDAIAFVSCTTTAELVHRNNIAYATPYTLNRTKPYIEPSSDNTFNVSGTRDPGNLVDDADADAVAVIELYDKDTNTPYNIF